MKLELFNDDCMNVMARYPDGFFDLVVTDPPYDIRNTKAGGSSKLAKSIQGMNDELSHNQICGGIGDKVLSEIMRVLKTPNVYLFCNKAQLPQYFSFFVGELGLNFELIKWVKTNATPLFNNKYLTDTEYVFYAHKGNLNPSCYEDAKTLYTAPINSKDKKAWVHPTIKPLELLEKLVRNSSREGDLILDPFMGSGTTGLASISQGRSFVGVEISNKWYSIANERINKHLAQQKLF